MRTNRDLYLHVVSLARRQGLGARPLADFLCNLRELSLQYRSHSGLSLPQFADLLSRAVDGEVAARDESGTQHPDFVTWLEVMDRQLAELETMAGDGTLSNPMRSFGVTVRGGTYWVNFDPATYLECASDGTFGGWQEGDDSGRNYVPGECVVQNENGEFEAVDPRTIPEKVVVLQELTWSILADFLMSGQQHE